MFYKASSFLPVLKDTKLVFSSERKWTPTKKDKSVSIVGKVN
jgi:hypothetical protein